MIGAGWVGFIQGNVFADEGRKVSFVDVDQDKLRLLKAGHCPFYEKDLEPMFRRSYESGRLSFTDDLKQAVEQTDGAFICVPTPPQADGDSDLSYVERVVREVAVAAGTREYPLIVKSTIPADRFRDLEKIVKDTPGSQVDLGSNPEFLAEGTAVEDCQLPSRIVIGVRNGGATRGFLEELYEHHRSGGTPFFVMSPEEAIMVKYAANVMLPVKISMANEVALLSEQLGCNARTILNAMGADPRIGPKFLHPGPGYGGDCFPKDTQGYDAMAKRLGITSNLAQAAIRTNARQRWHLFNRLTDYFSRRQETLAGREIAVWGLSFKKDTNDLRHSPAIAFIDQMLDAGGRVTAYDPAAGPEGRKRYADRIAIVDSAMAAVMGAEALVIVTDWKQFVGQDWEEVRKVMKHPVIFDGRSLLNPMRMAALGFDYISIGRPDALGAK